MSNNQQHQFSLPSPNSSLTIESKLGPLVTLIYSDVDSFPEKLKFYKHHIKNYVQAAFSDTTTSDEHHCEHVFNSKSVWFVFSPDIKTVEEAVAGGKIIAHSAFSPLNYKSSVDVLYHNGCVVDPEFEGNGIFSRVTKLGMERLGGDYYCCRTQNPAVIRGLQRSFGSDNVYTDILWRDTEKAKNPSFSKQIELVRGMGQMVAEFLHMQDNYERDTMIAREIYPKKLFQALAQKEYSGEIAERMSKYLDRQEGDCLLVFGKMHAEEKAEA